MKAFYCTQAASTTKINRINRLTFNMLGSIRKRMLHAKAMEMHCLLPVMLELLIGHSGKFGRRFEPLQKCVFNILRFFAICKREPRVMSADSIRFLQKITCTFLKSWQDASGHCVYKHHMAFHVAQLCHKTGNPRYFHTYADEQENRLLGQIAKRLHGSRRFYITFLQRAKMEIL